MAQAPVATVEDDGDVEAFIASVPDETRRSDARTLMTLMERVTGEPARMWGTAIVGFGRYHYVYATGREGDAAAVGFSPRKAATTIYLADGFDGYAEQLDALGPHSTGRSCLYLKRLDQVDLTVLEEMVRRSYAVTTTRTWPPA
jgi:hypothetical protein